MTVKELIEYLQTVDQELPVVMRQEGYGYFSVDILDFTTMIVMTAEDDQYTSSLIRDGLEGKEVFVIG